MPCCRTRGPPTAYPTDERPASCPGRRRALEEHPVVGQDLLEEVVTATGAEGDVEAEEAALLDEGPLENHRCFHEMRVLASWGLQDKNMFEELEMLDRRELCLKRVPFSPLSHEGANQIQKYIY